MVIFQITLILIVGPKIITSDVEGLAIKADLPDDLDDADAIIFPGEYCHCINIYKCRSVIETLKQFGQDRANEIRGMYCGMDGDDPKVCCPDMKDTSTSASPNVPGLKPVDPKEKSKCGFSAAKHTRIVGGIESQRGAWPWIAILGYRVTRSNVPRWVCGGTLISRRHIVTAAHCVVGKSVPYVVRLGEHNLDEKSEDDPYYRRPIDLGISYSVPSPGYNSTTLENDIAVLVLSGTVSFDEWIHPICLPSMRIANLNIVGFNPFVAGWGSTLFRGLFSDVVRETQVEVQPLSDCRRVYTEISNETKIDNRVICAGQRIGGQNSCQGDSGGPLMLPEFDGTHYWYLIGIVSYSFRCAEPGFPAIYTKVASHLEFIRGMVRQSGDQLCSSCGKS